MKTLKTQSVSKKKINAVSNQLPNSLVTAVTPHNKALYEAGKKLLVDSIDVGREFCRFMITTSTSAIPIYIAILKLVGIENITNKPSAQNFLVLAITPCFLFLASTVLYMFGYFPSTGTFSLDIVEQIEKVRQQVIGRRKQLITIASISFLLGICTAIATFVVILFP